MTPIFGEITPPITGYSTGIEGLTVFATNILRFIFLIGGIWAFINFIVAGFNFISAGPDPKKMENAWHMIWQTILGLIVMVASFILAAVVGFLVFNDPLFILKPRIYTPGP